MLWQIGVPRLPLPPIFSTGDSSQYLYNTLDTTAPTKQKHPPGLYLLFFTEMWERFSYYGMRGLLTLYLITEIDRGGLGFSDKMGPVIYGWFTGLVYLTPIIGGWLADNFLGQRRSILIGGLMMAAGQFCLAGGVTIDSFYQYALAATPAMGAGEQLSHVLAAIVGFPGLLLLLLGNGFFKPNISTLVGQLYEQGDPRRDSAFTIFYMGINLGAFLAPLVCGIFAEDIFASKDAAGSILHYGFRYGFLAAGIGMVLGQITFQSLAQKYLGNIGLMATKPAKGTVVVASEPLTKEEKDRMTVIFIVVVFVTFFWAGFEQAGSSLTIYTDRFIDRTVGSFTIPTSWFQSVNALFIVALGGPTAALWLYLANKKKDFPIPAKMALGMILLGIGFFFMIAAVYERGGDSLDETIKASIWWVILTYFFHTIGELCLSPIGLSMITRLAPVKYASMMMGVWFLSPFVAQVAGGYIAAYVEELGADAIFKLIAAFVIVAGVILFALNKSLVKMMHGRG